MPDPEIIDIHTHAFGTPNEGMEWQSLVGMTDSLRPGTAGELLQLMKDAGISRSVLLMYTPTRFMYEAYLKEHPLPPSPKVREKAELELKRRMVQRMVENNEWACQESSDHPELIPFIGLDPVYMDEDALFNEIDDKVKKGARGVKIVPRALAIFPNDKRLLPVYEKIRKMKIPLVSQSGRGYPNEREIWGSPRYFAQVLAEFPDLRVNLGHLGMGCEEEIVELCKRFPNVYADLSLRLHRLDQAGEFSTRELAEFIRRCGPEHIAFGTNYPLADPVLYARVLRQLPLTGEETEMVASGNTKRFLGIT